MFKKLHKDMEGVLKDPNLEIKPEINYTLDEISSRLDITN